MIRIYADESDYLAFMVRDGSIEVVPVPAYLGTPKSYRLPVRRRSIDLLTAALLIGVSGGGGYLLAPRSPPAHATAVAAASPPSDLVVPPQPNVIRPGPATGPDAVARALDSPPSITPPPAPKSTSPPGVAAFGLQP